MKWYEERYVSHRDWILDHLELLGMNAEETVLVLLIDFMNEKNLEISMDTLHQKSGMTEEKVNQVVSVLCARKYLEIRASSGNIRFVLDGLFEAKTAQEQNALDSSLFDLFETELNHPLTVREMEKISDWNRTTDRRLILYALREASTYQKLNLPYIESILKRWKAGGYTAEMIEEGKDK